MLQKSTQASAGNIHGYDSMNAAKYWQQCPETRFNTVSLASKATKMNTQGFGSIPNKSARTASATTS